jgi:hypothetical protein
MHRLGMFRRGGDARVHPPCRRNTRATSWPAFGRIPLSETDPDTINVRGNDHVRHIHGDPARRSPVTTSFRTDASARTATRDGVTLGPGFRLASPEDRSPDITGRSRLLQPLLFHRHLPPEQRHPVGAIDKPGRSASCGQYGHFPICQIMRLVADRNKPAFTLNINLACT